MYIDKSCEFTPYGTIPKLDKFVDSDKLADQKSAYLNNYGFDKLINSTYSDIRRGIAIRGFGLDILANDSDPSVKRAVASQGFAINKLYYDRDPEVRVAALNYLTEQRMLLSTWINTYPEKCIEYEFLFLDIFMCKLRKYADVLTISANDKGLYAIRSYNNWTIAYFRPYPDYMLVETEIHFDHIHEFKDSMKIRTQIDLDTYFINLTTELNKYDEYKDIANMLLDCLI